MTWKSVQVGHELAVVILGLLQPCVQLLNGCIGFLLEKKNVTLKILLRKVKKKKDFIHCYSLRPTCFLASAGEHFASALSQREAPRLPSWGSAAPFEPRLLFGDVNNRKSNNKMAFLTLLGRDRFGCFQRFDITVFCIDGALHPFVKLQRDHHEKLILSFLKK